MAEKNLRLEFQTASGAATSMTLKGAKQDLDATAVKAAMNNMVAAACFENSKGEAYTSAQSASYVETIETKIFAEPIA